MTRPTTSDDDFPHYNPEALDRLAKEYLLTLLHARALAARVAGAAVGDHADGHLRLKAVLGHSEWLLGLLAERAAALVADPRALHRLLPAARAAVEAVLAPAAAPPAPPPAAPPGAPGRSRRGR